MRKKSLIIPIAIIALVAFGSVTSANAFIDPISLSVIIGASFLTLVTANETIKHIKTESAKEHVNIPKFKKKNDGSTKISRMVTQVSDDSEN